MTDEAKKKTARYVAFAGFLLALVCHYLPPEYQTACEFVARCCKGGL